MRTVDAAQVERIVENLVANATPVHARRTPIWVRVRPYAEGVLIRRGGRGPRHPRGAAGCGLRAVPSGERGRHAQSGCGIGLSLVTRFAELHGGRAWVEEREGGGASFRVWLPAPHAVAAAV